MSVYVQRQFAGRLFLPLMLGLLIAFGALTSHTTQASSISKPRTATPSYAANIDFPYSTPYGSYSQQALANPNVDGVDINLNWSTVEPKEGVYNFAPLDREMNAWGQVGKKFVFVIRYADESTITTATSCDAFQYLPDWEVARIPHFCDTDRGSIIPDYFDTVFQHDVQAYVQAIADHVAQSPYRANVLYVRIGLGLAGEGMPLMTCKAGATTCDYADYQADLRQLVAYGYSPQHWEAWQESMLSAYQQAFAPTMVIYPINALALNPQTGNPVEMDVAYWAAAHGFGVGAQGLVPVPNYRYADLQIILPYIRQHYPNTYIQFQTVSSVSSYRAIAGDIQTASGYGARSVEWYESDITTSSFQPLFHQWQQSVQSQYDGSVRKALPILRPFRFPSHLRDIKGKRIA